MLDFIFGEEKNVIDNPQYTPVTTAFVIVESEKGYLLLYNKYRRLWELTGGMIEEGESAKNCAVRECKEESNQDISNLKFIGLAKFLMKKNEYRHYDCVEYSAVYFSFLNQEKIFNENSEIEYLRWWKTGDEVADICPASMELLKLYNPAL